jgi:glycosyltransferase involved in cell wall biosynthesis
MATINTEQVSIVVPVFNVREYLPKCIESLINQSYTKLEIILVDDGSFDGSELLCDSYAESDQRITVIHKKNGGQSSARNLGIQNATSEWITFVDADDYINEEYIRVLFSLVANNPVDISVVSFSFITSRKTVDHSTGEFSVMSGETAVKRMLLNDGFDMGPWAKLYRTQYFKKHLFPENKLFEDSLTTYQIMSEASKVAFKSVSLYNYVSRAGSTVNGRFNTQKLDLIEMTIQAQSFISGRFPNLEKEAHRRVIWAYFSTLNQVLNSGTDDQIQKYAPDIVSYLLSQGDFITKYPFVPKRDKIAYLTLYFFGLRGYKHAWKLYERMTR